MLGLSRTLEAMLRTHVAIVPEATKVPSLIVACVMRPC